MNHKFATTIVAVNDDEVLSWFERYLVDFVALGRGDAHDVRLLLNHYDVPLLLGTDAGATILATEQEVLAVCRQQVHGMRAAGYDCSERIVGETTVLNRSCATHRARFARRRADGSHIAEIEATYLITDQSTGRRISAILLHSPSDSAG